MDRQRLNAAFNAVARAAKTSKSPEQLLRDHVHEGTIRSDGDSIRRLPGGATQLKVDGCWYRIHDVTEIGGKIRRLSLESPEATMRVFVTANGMQKRYAFDRHERRVVTASACERQWKAAKYFTPSNMHGHVNPR